MNSKIATLRPAQLRPGERVTQYLLDEFANAGLENGSRLPTNRELAQRLKVSVPTVQMVLRKLAKEGRVYSRSGKGTFLISQPDEKLDEIRVGVSSPLGQGRMEDAWLSPICSGIFQEAMQFNPAVTLASLSADVMGTDAVPEELTKMGARVDGLILFPYVLFPAEKNDQIRDFYEAKGKPVVALNPPAIGETANFVSPDYLGASRRLGQVWRETGRRRVLMMMNGTLASAPSPQLRFLGMTLGYAPDPERNRWLRVQENSGSFENQGYETMIRWLGNRKTWPDAVYCAGDFLALGALRALREHRVAVPRDVSVVGGSGVNLSHTPAPNLTRTEHPLEELGRQLLRMLVERIRRKSMPIPGRYLPTPFIGGATTRPEENALLEIRHVSSFQPSVPPARINPPRSP